MGAELTSNHDSELRTIAQTCATGGHGRLESLSHHTHTLSHTNTREFGIKTSLFSTLESGFALGAHRATGSTAQVCFLVWWAGGAHGITLCPEVVDKAGGTHTV